ncbi:leucine-rich repeat and IQ domain-containing protein 1 [Chiloscyllium plagiosum]|uniref:leucine-rich repeat and IQ domain-containing protein 1 n=1 Tax=Chiloscyllium plagiosum TaxID=36176 RepID=UPI001CB860BA|nr:leucine-rich repeat and IQ domain-containing protein 1 [Chiloscyllium plagiosum]
MKLDRACYRCPLSVPFPSLLSLCSFPLPSSLVRPTELSCFNYSGPTDSSTPLSPPKRPRCRKRRTHSAGIKCISSASFTNHNSSQQIQTEIMDEDKLIEEAVEAELRQINISPSEIDELEEQSEEDILVESDYDSDELPKSVLDYLEHIKQRTGNVEKLILQDLEQPDYAVYPERSYPGTDMLMELAAEFGEDHLNLKEKILVQIEEEEQRMQTHVEPQQNMGTSVQMKTGSHCAENETMPDNEETLARECKEVEERCQLSLQQWEIEQEVLKKTKLAELMEWRKREKELAVEEEERAKSRQQQFEEKLEKLAEERQQQQIQLEKKIGEDQEHWEQKLKEHEALIQAMQIKMDEERRIFEEQQHKERIRVEEVQNRASAIIQARFRAYLVRKRYAPILRERQDERKRKKDLELRMAEEKKAFEENIKRKLEQKQKEEEKEGKRWKEVEQLQREEQKRRQIEYEKKKEQERQRLEKERQQKLEKLQNLREDEKRKELQRRRNEEKQKEIEHKKEEENKLLEKENKKVALSQREDKEIEKEHKPQLVEERDFYSSINKEAKHDDNNSETASIPLIQSIGFFQNIEENSTLANDSQDVSQCIVAMATDTNLKVKLLAEETVEKTAENTLAIECNIPPIPKNRIFLQKSRVFAVSDKDPGRLSGEGISILNTSSVDLHKEDLIDASKVTSSMDHDFEEHLSVSELTLPDHVEQKRLSWMKICTPWSKISRENKLKKVKQHIRLQTIPVNRLPPLSPGVILQSGVWNSLQQVRTVTLQDLPGFSLSTFSQCLLLQSLTLQNCGIETLEGINNCKGLKYIDVQENKIKHIHCLELENLCILLLSHNQITSIHGLENCSNLQVLELSHNNITRIGGLESFKKLQRLVVDHNELISTKGLSETPTLLYLDCSFNYLDSIEGIDNCGLLQTLKLQNNNLSELPKFRNHVLLRELYLDDNSISSLKVLSEYWLPMLQHLSVSQNSLTDLTAMSDFLLLERLNVSNNRLSDLKSFLLSLNGCHRLLELLLHGNPLQQESGWRCSILKTLSNLKILDGERISSTDTFCAKRHNRPSSGSFLALCQAQLQDSELLLKRHETELELDSLDITGTRCQHCDELMQLAEECRYAHEYGESCLTEQKKHPNTLHEEELSVEKQYNKLTINHTEGNSQNADRKVVSDPVQTVVTYASEKIKQSDQSHLAYQDSEHSDPRLLVNQGGTILQDFGTGRSPLYSKYNKVESQQQNKEHVMEKHQQHISEDNLENYAAIVLQSHWRGYIVRKEIQMCMILHNAASVIQAAWRDYCNRMKVAFQKTTQASSRKCKIFGGSQEIRHKAVTIIQAHWRGCLLRKKLSHALAAVQTEEEDVFEEVDLSEFTFDETTLNKDWITSEPASSPQAFSTENHYQQLKAPHKATDLFGLPRQRQRAWQDDDINSVEKFGSPSLSPATTSVVQTPRTISGFSEVTSCSKQGFKSQKEEQISLEWGFKNAHTAQLMLKRAQKMKSKKAEAKKLLDPVVRLALFKNKKNKYSPVKPKKKACDRVEYFRAIEELTQQDTTSTEVQQKSRELTYQWLHTQVVNDEQTNYRIMKNHHFLPELDADVLNGGRVQLMASHVGKECSDLDIVSVSSGSTINQPSDGFNYSHRRSSGSTQTIASLKIGTKPLKQERISFRSNQVRLSTGWGSGKRRGKTL